jgi:hypothetical protein
MKRLNCVLLLCFFATAVLASENETVVRETTWNVDNTPTHWVFHGDGRVEAPGKWTGHWTWTKDKQRRHYAVRLSYKGKSDAFTVVFSADDQSFIAYKNGAIYRRGKRLP